MKTLNSHAATLKSCLQACTEIRDLIREMGAYGYSKSYQYVGFVYSGHGGNEDMKSVLVRVDESFVDISEDVVKPVKNINSSICKLTFFDACCKSGRATKGPKANCLVAYATQFGMYAYKHETLEGSLWLLRLAKKQK